MMKITKYKNILLVLSILLFSQYTQASIINGNFDTGDLSGWSTSTTASGDLGINSVVQFDVNGDGDESSAAQFQVGQNSGNIGGVNQEGGGILQSFTSLEGMVDISLDVAIQGLSNNGSGGLFALLLDGILLDSFDFGFVLVNEISRSTLGFAGLITAGSHELSLQITRPFGTDGSAPLQYLDNVLVDVTADAGNGIPISNTFLIFLVGLFVMRKFRQRTHSNVLDL